MPAFPALWGTLPYIYFTNNSDEFEIGQDHYFCNMRITIEQNGQFHVGIYHEKIQLDQIQNGRPAATFDFNMCNNWKTVPDS